MLKVNYLEIVVFIISIHNISIIRHQIIIFGVVSTSGLPLAFLSSAACSAPHCSLTLHRCRIFSSLSPGLMYIQLSFWSSSCSCAWTRNDPSPDFILFFVTVGTAFYCSWRSCSPPGRSNPHSISLSPSSAPCWPTPLSFCRLIGISRTSWCSRTPLLGYRLLLIWCSRTPSDPPSAHCPLASQLSSRLNLYCLWLIRAWVRGYVLAHVGVYCRYVQVSACCGLPIL